MSFSYKFAVSHLAHFSGDTVEVNFENLTFEHRVYSGLMSYKCTGVHLAELTLHEYVYASVICDMLKPGRGIEVKERVALSKEIHRLLRGQWKDFTLALCRAKQVKVLTELEKAQRKVEKLLLARDKLQQITGE
jgi:hypothetical protein